MSRVCTTHGVINPFNISVRKHEGKRAFEHLRKDGKKIFTCILKKSVEGSCEYGTYKPAGCHKRQEKILDELGSH
jgi:hypothetical protein